INEAFGRTTGGNQSWSFPSPSYPFYVAPPIVFERINAFDSKDCQSGWAVGYTGAVAATTDSGNSWTGQAAAAASQAAAASTANTGYLASIAANNPSHAYALSIDSITRPNTTAHVDIDSVYVTIISTNDGGRSWSVEYGDAQTNSLT